MGLLLHLLLCTFVILTLGGERGVTALSTVRHPPHILETEKQSLFALTIDSTHQFKCIADGVPTPSVEWIQTKSLAPDPSRKTALAANGFLPPNEFTVNMQGYYQCVAKNMYGTAVTNHIKLVIAQDAVFDINADPVLDQGIKGEPKMIKCLTTRPSLPKATFQWRVHEDPKSDVPVSQLTSGWRMSIDNKGSLYFAYLEMDDNRVINGIQWTYMCYALNPIVQSNKYGSPTRLNVQDGTVTPKKPSIPSTLSANNVIHILENEDLDLFCFFNGYPKITYTWTKTSMPAYVPKDDGTHIVIDGAKDTELYNGEYVCNGKNTQGQESIIYKVIVDVPPYFDNNPNAVKDTNATDGSTIDFKCIALGKPTPTIEWRKNNIPVTAENKGPRVSFTVNGNEGTYKIEKVQKGNDITASDLSVITCYAKSPIGESFGSGYINVFNSFVISTPPRGVQLVNRDMVINLDCGVTGDPNKPVHVDWYHDNIKLIMNKGKIEKLPNNTLRIYVKEYGKSDEALGNYSCYATTEKPFQRIIRTAEVYTNGTVIQVTTAGGGGLWWIAIIVAIILIIIILLLIFCCIKRNKGESYPVDENERKTGNVPENDLHKPEHGGFNDYQRNEKDPIGGSRASISGSIKALDSDDDDGDSMAEYGEVDNGQFNEDGSFIGQYVPDKNKNTRHDAAPPPYSKSGSDTMV
ncbi:neural cell adhesion molecule L1-like protein [Lineus longissimus]|uniref:neural cell adhesion molecule L1-like protein n=1 Tax=Lineus longissimus TaxID=88925 RepID=UPI002B4E6FEC